MTIGTVRGAALFALAMLLMACAREAGEDPARNAVSRDAAVSVADADSVPGQWLTHGRTYSEQRYSPLAQVNTETVARLGLAWAYDLGVSRGIEATPIVADGVMYVTGTWNVVHALDARTGSLLWRFDPEVDRSRGRYLCCDAVNRGVAWWQGKIFVGTIDGRLIALNAKTGRKLWDVLTIDTAMPYTITGAPRVVKNRVIIGNGGAEFGVRGYVSAYDVDTGDLAWRFYTVPGNPQDGFESAIMARAAATWTGEWWRYGGGGTVWDSMAYDPELDLLYIGVGNGSPWNQAIRSPAGGDNLFLSSIVALRPETGEYVWHYQTTPGETWDYTATQHMILADLEIEGKPRKVILQAPKNGFFYVLDRASGELISAQNYVTVSWATGVDPDTGRPVEVAGARWGQGGEPVLQLPSPFGGHNWHPMAFSPRSGLVYIPAMEMGFLFDDDAEFRVNPSGWNTGADLSLAAMPTDPAQLAAIKAMTKGRLLAWDPVRQQAAWAVDHDNPWNGGVLATAGDLVFQGTADARLAAYHADSGKKLWDHFVQTGVVAPPISYSVDGEQYIAVATGWGGAFVLAYSGVFPAVSVANAGRVLVFKLDGEARLPALPVQKVQRAKPPALTASAEVIERGRLLYARNCTTCHGDHVRSSGLVPDLRYSAFLADADAWSRVVSDGAMVDRGMPAFGGVFDNETVSAIRAYVTAEANKAH